MMRYFTMNAPGGANAAALVPQLPVTPRALTYPQVRIIGQPGTQGISAPRPNSLVPISQQSTTQPSNCAPNVIFPSIYYTTPDNMHPPVSLFRDNQLPIPAVGNYGGVGALPQAKMRRRRTGSSEQIGWPATVSRWGSVNRVGN